MTKTMTMTMTTRSRSPLRDHLGRCVRDGVSVRAGLAFLARTTRAACMVCAVSAACPACDSRLDQRLAIIDQPSVLAVIADPAEARPGATVSYTAVIASPDGPVAAALRWAFCVAPKPPTEDNAVSDRCLNDASVISLGTQPAVTAALPSDGCLNFGPETPPGNFRPRDADATGGYYQPIRIDVDDLRAFGLSRITCKLATAPSAVAHDLSYVANKSPTLDPPALPSVAAQTDITLTASWPAEAAETYLSYEQLSQTLVTRREASGCRGSPPAARSPSTPAPSPRPTPPPASRRSGTPRRRAPRTCGWCCATAAAASRPRRSASRSNHEPRRSDGSRSEARDRDASFDSFQNRYTILSMLPGGLRGLHPRVRRVLGEHGAIVRSRQLFEAGVHPRTLYGLRDAGQLEQVGHGLYRLASAPVPPHLDLLVVASRAPRAVVCLISALAFHELTDEIPHEVSIAVLRGSAPPRIQTPPVRVFHFSEAAYRLGIEHHMIEGVDLKVYNPAKSIVDAFRFRNRIGEDVAIKALATGLRTRRVRPGPLLELAGKLRARAVITPYLKALT